MDLEFVNKLRSHIIEYQKRRLEKVNLPGLVKHELKKISYGTSGFRGEAAQIDHIFYNIGLISAIRSLYLKSNVGIMITASHNPIEDNGVKLIDSNGEMLEISWEPVVEEFCNTQDAESIIEQLKKLMDTYDISTDIKETSCRVLVAMDTRPSSEALSTLIKQGLDAWSPLVTFVDCGQITTPALHYLVGMSNNQQICPITAYYDQLVVGLVDAFRKTSQSNTKNSYCSSDLVVDCANGVGNETMQYFCNNNDFKEYLKINLINTGVDGILNKMCGADYVKTTHNCPLGANEKGKRYASLDGDADRVVYFYLPLNSVEETSKVNLLDGDKIMALFASYLKDGLKELDLEKALTMGLVQTAYANGSSTDYISKELNLNIDCVDTGVKNLHKKVVEYDVGVYFEANGHGTIWISPKARRMIDERGDSDLKRFLAVINSFTGDAISDILAVEIILRHYGWSIEDWYRIYEDRPSRLMAEKVSNRCLYKTANAGRTLIEPVGIQEEIDLIVSKYMPKARCFVRPSGTEDIVRIYSEAETQELSDHLAEEVRQKIKMYS